MGDSWESSRGWGLRGRRAVFSKDRDKRINLSSWVYYSPRPSECLWLPLLHSQPTRSMRASSKVEVNTPHSPLCAHNFRSSHVEVKRPLDQEETVNERTGVNHYSVSNRRIKPKAALQSDSLQRWKCLQQSF